MRQHIIACPANGNSNFSLSHLKLLIKNASPLGTALIFRPQLLVLCSSDLDEVSGLRHERLMAFVSQLKAGKGLTVLASVIEGHYVDCSAVAEEVRNVS